MIRITTKFWMILLYVLLGACASTTRTLQNDTSVEPATYEPITSIQSLDRSVKLLKRLAILPLTLGVSPKSQSWCMEPCYPDQDQAAIATSVVDYLTDWRGYEVLHINTVCQEEHATTPLDSEICSLSRSLENWSDKAKLEDSLPETIADKIASLGSQLNVDGFLLIHGNIDYVQYLDTLHWTATLTASAYWDLFRGNVAKLQTEIYSVADQKRVWISKSTLTQIGSHTNPRQETYGESLMVALEPAIPDVLIHSKEETVGDEVDIVSVNDHRLLLDTSSPPVDKDMIDSSYKQGMDYIARRIPVAWELLCVAANANHGRAQKELAYWHRTDIQLPDEPPRFRSPLSLDSRTAYLWYRLAEMNGVKGANVERVYVSSKLSREELTEAAEMVNNWKPGQCPAPD